MSVQPKSVDNGRFQIYDAIGAGAVATVYRAYDRSRNQMCALKLLNEESADNEKRRQRFLSEAQTLQNLTHPHIVPVRAMGEQDGRLWIAMELMEGGSAARALKRGGALPAPRALEIIHKILLGLQVAHDAGIVHRDVKPQNILLGADGAVKLCDFGIARQERPAGEEEEDEEGGLTQMFDRLGSIIYMAPEQRADPRDVSAATDVYAAGASLFALLSGRRPPDLSRAPIRPQMLDPIAPPLRPLILTACAVRREQRYPSAAAMADEIARLMEDAGRNPRWYETPRLARPSKEDDEYAQWPTRPGETPGAVVARLTPQPAPSGQQRPLYRPQTPRGDVDLELAAGVAEAARAATPPPAPAPRLPASATVVELKEPPPAPVVAVDRARAATPPPAPRAAPGPPLWRRVPRWAWIALAAGLGLGVFVFGLGGGLLVVWLLTR